MLETQIEAELATGVTAVGKAQRVVEGCQPAEQAQEQGQRIVAQVDTLA